MSALILRLAGPTQAWDSRRRLPLLGERELPRNRLAAVDEPRRAFNGSVHGRVVAAELSWGAADSDAAVCREVRGAEPASPHLGREGGVDLLELGTPVRRRPVVPRLTGLRLGRSFDASRFGEDRRHVDEVFVAVEDHLLRQVPAPRWERAESCGGAVGVHLDVSRAGALHEERHVCAWGEEGGHRSSHTCRHV